MLIFLNVISALFGIVSAFCWFRSAVRPNEQVSFWERISHRFDKHLEKVPGPTWNWLAAIATAVVAFLQAIITIINTLGAI